jgi:ankyrin repeat protein
VRAQLGYTPLHVAAVKGRASVVTLLYECGADKDAKNNVRSTRAHTRRSA